MRFKGLIWIGGLLGCGSMIGGGMLLLIVTVMVVLLVPDVGGGILQICAPNKPGGGSGVVQAKATTKAGSIPKNYYRLYVAAGKEWNIPWNVLAGIGYVETHHGTLQAQGVHSGENYAGAGGPMQFLKSTFDRVKVDGDGDGKRSRYDPDDAIFSAAKLLKVHIIGIGAGKKQLRRTLTAAEIRKSLYSYNHSWKYVDNVLSHANRYADDPQLTKANYAGSATCAGPVSLGSGSFGQRIANAAAYYAKKDPGTPRPPSRKDKPTPYSWGGGTLTGPSYGIQHGSRLYGFDCSGLARYAVHKASGGKVVLARTTFAMWRGGIGTKITGKRLAPGDLVFFNGLKHMAIYWGEFGGERWMVEALKTGTPIKFSRFDTRRRYVGALRISPPAGMKDPSPDTIRALARPGAGPGEGAV